MPELQELLTTLDYEMAKATALNEALQVLLGYQMCLACGTNRVPNYVRYCSACWDGE